MSDHNESNTENQRKEVVGRNANFVFRKNSIMHNAKVMRDKMIFSVIE